MAWDIIFNNSEPGEISQCFQTLFPSEDYFEEFHLSRLHRIVLGLLPSSLGLELPSISLSEVDLPDARGRSALSWAALRGDQEAVSLLLEAGSSVHTVDIDVNTPLLLSVEKDDPRSMNLLLEAGADVEHKNNRERNALIKAMEHREIPSSSSLFSRLASMSTPWIRDGPQL